MIRNHSNVTENYCKTIAINVHLCSKEIFKTSFSNMVHFGISLHIFGLKDKA